MTWYDVDDILYSGTEKEIQQVRCPDCNKKIEYKYNDNPRVFEIKCITCGYLSRAHGGERPKCVKYFGDRYDWT